MLLSSVSFVFFGGMGVGGGGNNNNNNNNSYFWRGSPLLPSSSLVFSIFCVTGLWHSLCPSFSRFQTEKSLNQPAIKVNHIDGFSSPFYGFLSYLLAENDEWLLMQLVKLCNWDVTKPLFDDFIFNEECS